MEEIEDRRIKPNVSGMKLVNLFYLNNVSLGLVYICIILSFSSLCLLHSITSLKSLIALGQTALGPFQSLIIWTFVILIQVSVEWWHIIHSCAIIDGKSPWYVGFLKLYTIFKQTEMKTEQNWILRFPSHPI